MKVRISGRSCNLTPASVFAAIENVDPQPGRRFYILSNGMEYPIKQAVSAATCVPTIAFPTNQAFSILKRLGLEIVDKEEG